MKKIFSSFALVLGLCALLNADEIDLLALVSKGALSENSAGVKKLSLEEEKQVQGGYRVFSASWYAQTHIKAPMLNNYNANTRFQTDKQKIYSNAFMQGYKAPSYTFGGIRLGL